MRQVSGVSATSSAKSAGTARPPAAASCRRPPRPLGTLGILAIRVRRRGGGAGGLATGGAARLPGLDLGLDVAGGGDDRRSAGELAAGVDHAGVEVAHHPAYAVRAGLA